MIVIDHFVGTYNGSCSWFEARIIRDGVDDDDEWLGDAAGEPTELLGLDRRPELEVLQHIVTQNLIASSKYKVHVVRWTFTDRDSTGDFVQSLKKGDRVMLVATAKVSLAPAYSWVLLTCKIFQFHTWVNHVRSAAIDIIYRL